MYKNFPKLYTVVTQIINKNVQDFEIIAIYHINIGNYISIRLKLTKQVLKDIDMMLVNVLEVLKYRNMKN